MREYEYCCECNNRVPDTENSVYAGSRGPFCEGCYSELPGRLAEECDMKHGRIKDLIAENKRLKERVERLREALNSIAANTCCEPCQEAKRVAQAALADTREER